MKRLASFFVVLALVLTMLPATVFAESKTIYVNGASTEVETDGTQDKPFKQISDAVNAASSGDTIIISAFEGEYDVFCFTKSLIFKGISEDGKKPVVACNKEMTSLWVSGVRGVGDVQDTMFDNIVFKSYGHHESGFDAAITSDFNAGTQYAGLIVKNCDFIVDDSVKTNLNSAVTPHCGEFTMTGCTINGYSSAILLMADNSALTKVSITNNVINVANEVVNGYWGNSSEKDVVSTVEISNNTILGIDGEKTPIIVIGDYAYQQGKADAIDVIDISNNKGAVEVYFENINNAVVTVQEDFEVAKRFSSNELASASSYINKGEAFYVRDSVTGEYVLCELTDENAIIEHTNHKEEVINKRTETCIEKGYTGDKICAVCKAPLAKGEEIPAAGHKFVDGVCTCGLSIKVEAEVTDTVPSTPTEESTEVPKVEEVTVVETTETKKAEASVKAEATEIVATTMTEGTDKLVEEKVIDKETAANLEAVTEAINGNGAAMVAAGLLTEEQVKVIEEAVEKGETVVKAEITVEEVKTTEVEKTVQTAIEEKAVKSIAKEAIVAQYLDVTVALKAAGKTLGTIDKLEEPITITIAIPEELKVENAKYYVLRNHDGEVTLLSTKLNEDGTISFTTDQFSTYALAYTKEAVKGSPATGDSSVVMPYIVMAVAALAVVVVLKKRESFGR